MAEVCIALGFCRLHGASDGGAGRDACLSAGPAYRLALFALNASLAREHFTKADMSGGVVVDTSAQRPVHVLRAI